VSYPRVLHLGFHPIGAPTNSGVTLGTMFGDWPQDRLLQVCMRAHPNLTTPPNAIIAPPSIAPLDGMVRRALGSRVPSGAVDGMNNSIQRSGVKSLRVRARLLATALNDVGPVRLPSPLQDEVIRFRPQVLHSLLGGVRAMRLALAFSKKLGIPIVPHFMDDWPDNLFQHGQLAGYARWTSERTFARVLERSPVCLSIGTDMRREFESRYGRPCPVVGNSVDFGTYENLMGKVRGDDNILTLSYVGGLHLGRDQVIESVAGALLGRLAAGRAWCLDLFVPPADAGRADALALAFRSIRHRGSLDPKQVPTALVESDALVFLESSDPAIARFTRLSVSTKVPEYLASARPILVLGPEEQGSVRALRRSGVSVYAGEAVDATGLHSAISELEARVIGGKGAPDNRPASWLAEEFGTAATRERLISAVSQAALSVARRA
jgi:hypothetical protein